MGEAEVNEGVAGESSRLIDGAQPAALEMRELRSGTNADSPDVSGTGVEFNTALHRAVLSFCGNDKKRADSYKEVCRLMNCQKRNLNMPNKEGYTAIGCAVEHSHKKCVKHMLKHQLSHKLHLDYYPGDRESTMREIILEKYPELQQLLPAPLMEILNTSDGDKKLLAAVQRDKFKAFRKCLNETNANLWYDEPYHSSLLEIACQMRKRGRFVKLLLDKGADPNIKNRVTGMPLIHATARSGNFEVLELLLKKKETDLNLKDYKDRTILHWLAQVRERKPDDKYILENCFKHLLDKHCVMKIGIDFRDVSGNTALCIALERGFQDRAKLLLSEGADVSVLENGSKVLLLNSLSLLTEILEDCLTSNNELLTSKYLQITLNFQLLTNILPRIAESQHLRELLKHPVMSAFLFLKWLNVRFIFFLYMAFYFTFLCFLTRYILYSETYNTLNDGGAARNTTDTFSSNDSNITSGMFDNNFTKQPNNSGLLFLWLCLMVLFSLVILREVCLFFLIPRACIFSLEYWLEILLIIVTFISCSGVVDGTKIKSHFSAVTLLLGWFEFVLMSGRLPLFSLQLVMLKTVSFTFLKFMASYAHLLIAFSFSFYILFKGDTKLDDTNMFANPFISLLKTIVMLAGEFEASSLSFDTLPYTSHVIFVLFVFLVTIVLLNLLVAVSDTDAIRKNAETLILLAKVRLISQIEAVFSALPQFVKRFVGHFLELRKEMFTLYPNRENSVEFTYLRSLLSIISEKRKPKNKRKSTGIQEESSMFTEKLSALQILHEELEKKTYSKFEEIHNILMQILNRSNIPESDKTLPYA